MEMLVIVQVVATVVAVAAAYIAGRQHGYNREYDRCKRDCDKFKAAVTWYETYCKSENRPVVIPRSHIDDYFVDDDSSKKEVDDG